MIFHCQSLRLFVCFLLLNIATSTILIASPALNNFPESKIPYSYTNIGTIPYGKTLVFDLKQKLDFNFCLSFDKFNTTLLTQPTYLIINPAFNHCTFVTQVLTAQQLGAKGVIIVSDYVDYFGKMVLIDDGNGRKVHISVLMIDTQTYEQLNTLKKVQIKVQFEIKTTDKVNLTYFLSASGRQNYIFLREFKPYYEKLSNYINFKPVYETFKCRGCSQEDCYISNDYCMFDMDTYTDNVGEEVVQEQIKQWSIWKAYGVDNYLSYMNQFDKLCTSNWINSEDCGDRILRKMELFRPKVTEAPSAIMDDWRKEEVESGFISTPQLTINFELYAGTQNSTQVFQALCSFLTNPPLECSDLDSIPVNKGNKVAWIVTSIFVACILSILLGYFIYKKCVKKQLTKDMFSKVNELVAKYATKVSDHNKMRKEKIKMRLTEEL